jgi:energy-coupling factor transporter ATP-binding protein EcfA2
MVARTAASYRAFLVFTEPGKLALVAAINPRGARIVIRSVEIKALRGIQAGKLEDLSPLVVLVGPNGSGKSTVLEALLIGASPLPAEAALQVIRRHEAGGVGARWLLWRAGQEDGTAIDTALDSGFTRTCVLQLDRSRPPSEALINLQIMANGHSLSGGVVHADQSQSRVLQSTGFLPLGELRQVRLIEGYPSATQPPLYDLYSNAARHGRQSVGKEVISEVLPAVRSVEILTEGAKPIVYLVFDQYSVPATLCGDGVASLLRFSLELASGSGVALLEEPEVHQHPGAMRRTAQVILAAVRHGIQVILTTHSLEFIDAIVAESSPQNLHQLSLYRLVLEDGTLRSSRLSGPDVALARGEIEDDLR